MAFRAEDVILQPLWKIHNIDWSDRRNVFETDFSRPSFDLLRRNSFPLSRYDMAGYPSVTCVKFDKFDNHTERDRQLNCRLLPRLCFPWSTFTADTVHTTA